MIPGMPGKMNARQLNQMMRRLGINVTTIENVEQVVIQTDSKEYVFENVEVTVMEAQGQKTYQISGSPTVRNRGEDKLNDDVQLIMDQTGKSEEEARKALEESQGDIAEAILKLTG